MPLTFFAGYMPLPCVLIQVLRKWWHLRFRQWILLGLQASEQHDHCWQHHDYHAANNAILCSDLNVKFPVVVITWITSLPRIFTESSYLWVVMWIPWVSCSPMASFQSNEAVRPGQLNQHHHNNPGDNHGGYDHHHRGDNHSSNHHYCGHYNTCKHHCSHYSQHHRWNNYDYGLHDFGCDDCHDHGFGGVQETLWEVRGYELRWGNLLRAWLLVGGFKYIFRFDIVCGMNQYLSPLGSLRLVVCVWRPLLLPVQDHHHHHALRVRLARTAERCPVSDPINLRPHTR